MLVTFNKLSERLKNKVMTFFSLENISSLYDGYRRLFKLDGQEVLLIQHEGVVSLLESTCPHAGYPMLDSKIIDSKLRCQMHGYLFDLVSGECKLSIEGPCRGLKVYVLVYRENEVGVMI